MAFFVTISLELWNFFHNAGQERKVKDIKKLYHGLYRNFIYDLYSCDLYTTFEWKEIELEIIFLFNMNIFYELQSVKLNVSNQTKN